MPNSWDPERYMERAKAWRDRAASLPEESPERDACVTLAEGYERLAKIIEARGCDRVGTTIHREHRSASASRD
jgi:hypothetical protein